MWAISFRSITRHNLEAMIVPMNSTTYDHVLVSFPKTSKSCLTSI